MSVFATVRLIVDVELERPWSDDETMVNIVEAAKRDGVEIATRALGNSRVVRVVPQGAVEVRTRLADRD